MTLENDRKVPIDLIQPCYAKVDSASCYPIKNSDNIVFYAGQKNNDENTLKIKEINTKWGKQIELVVIGSYHSEKISYNKTDNWTSWIRIDIPISEIDKIIEKLKEIKKNNQINSELF